LASFIDQGAISQFQFVMAVAQSPEYLGRVVSQMYQSVLGRPADASSQQAGVFFLEAGGSQTELKALLYGSPEYCRHAGGTDAGFLATLFQDLNGRPIDSATESMLDGLLSSGVSRTVLALRLLQISGAG
jgi:hypothetical protein